MKLSDYSYTWGNLSVLEEYLPTIQSSRRMNYEFFLHYHPFSDEFIEKINLNGLPALLDVSFQESLLQSLAPNIYQPTSVVKTPFPKENLDLDNGAYAIYNWELFFHAPLAVAVHLSQNQRFADAQKWFHFIYDPTSNDESIPAADRPWKFLKFRQESNPETIQKLLAALANIDSDNPEIIALREQVLNNIDIWRNNPFQPHLIAQGRFIAYQWNVLMKYLDNLLAWGDSLFRQDTMETINEATQLYVLAANILGTKPQKIPPTQKYRPKSYAQIKEAGLDEFGNAMVELENLFPVSQAPGGGSPSGDEISSILGFNSSLYFCIPPNEKLLSYWDKVGDRLFKIRNCMNIQGVVRQLPLFEPPIDPGMLVKAVAAGLDIGSIANNINQPVSNIRGPLLIQKALEVCSEVRAMGNFLLSVIEKENAEKLTKLTRQQEIKLLNLIAESKFLQWKEAENGTQALLKTRNTTFERYKHYKLILGSSESDIDTLKTLDLDQNELSEENFDEVYREWVEKYGEEITKEAYRKETTMGGLMEFAGETVTDIAGGELGKTLPLNKNENAELNIYLPASDTFSSISTGLRLAAPILALIPQLGGHGTPVGVGARVDFGGEQLSKAAIEGAKFTKKISDAFAESAVRASKLAGYYRRAEEFVLQANLAASELQQFGRQIISSLIREQYLKKEYDKQLVQIEQAEEVSEFIKDKFNNEEFYSWMRGELSKAYFEHYKFAYDIAKKAEQTLKHELMRPEFDEQNFIKYGYWDSAREGLLTGENLGLDLKRLEMAYHEYNGREYEITKQVSLKRLDSYALLQLKASGSCEVDIPEWVYDLDSPGQYMRRIKTVAISIPAITGPHTSIHCKVSLLRSSIRTSSLVADGYERATNEEDTRFRDFTGAIESIITSNAQKDSGLFETSLKDTRYLPFEGAGAVSRWRIELPHEIPQFDFDTISDFIFHVRYTAREAGHLKTDAASHTKTILEDSVENQQLFTLNHEFSAEWLLFTQAVDDNSRNLSITISKDNLPYFARSIDLKTPLTARFFYIKWDTNQLKAAPAALPFVDNGDETWTINIDKNSPVFSFLKSNMTKKIYLSAGF